MPEDPRLSVTSNILQRTFQIRYAGSTGTCFTIDVESRRYLVTARHVVESLENDAVVEISHNRAWVPLPVQLVGHGPEDIDLTVLAPQQVFRIVKPANPHNRGPCPGG